MGEYSSIVNWEKTICVWNELLSSILQKKFYNFISTINASPVQSCKLSLMIFGIYFDWLLISLFQNFQSLFLVIDFWSNLIQWTLFLKIIYIVESFARSKSSTAVEFTVMMYFFWLLLVEFNQLLNHHQLIFLLFIIHRLEHASENKSCVAILVWLVDI